MTTLRYLALGVPLLAVMAAARANRDRSGAFLAFVTAFVGIAALHEVATAARWYSFAPVDGAYRGMPVDLWIGWAALWGPLPVLLRRIAPLPVTLGLLAWVDLVAMPALDPLVRLEPRWLLGELCGLVFVALPAQLLGRWTADRQRLAGRATLQVGVFTGLVMWLLPSVAFTLGDGSWGRLLALPAPGLFAFAQVAALIAVPALAAVREFAVRGGGTPFPWDPPARLVTTGPYAYVANPMQLSAVLLLLLLAGATRSWSLALGALVAAVFSVVVAEPHERSDMHARHGDRWADYRREVRDWWPRRRPWVAGRAARLFLDDDCGPCTAVARSVRHRSPAGLAIVPASSSPVVLWRARYVDGDGYVVSGVAAVARGFGHLSLGWAYAGWVLGLPVLGWLAQLVTDALIAPPHPAGGTSPPPGKRLLDRHPAGSTAARSLGGRPTDGVVVPPGRRLLDRHPAGGFAGAPGKMGAGPGRGET